MAKKRKAKYTQKITCSITGDMKSKLRKIRRDQHTTYAALIRAALDSEYAS